MKQKNYKWLFYIVILGLIAGVGYVALQDIMPEQTQVEKEIKIRF